MRPFLRPILLIVALLLGTTTGAGAGERPPTAREMQRDANRMARELARAERDIARSGDRITALQSEIATLQAEIEPLRALITRRAVAVYTSAGSFEAVPGLASATDPVDAARAARIVAGASAADLALIADVEAASAVLDLRQAALEDNRERQQMAMDVIAGERRNLEVALAIMDRNRRQVADRMAAARSRQARAARSTAQQMAPARSPEMPAEFFDPGNIATRTDFTCPINGPVAFTDSWGDARSGGRSHKGTDLMNPHGTDNVAVVSGVITKHSSGRGGLSIYLYGDDGNTYFYAHLSEVVGGDRRVAQGELIGRTGATGNARGGSPHTHFEIHQGGATAVNPYPAVAAACR